MKKSTFCKVLMVLALLIAVAVPVCAMSGSGTSGDPYTIANLADLKMVANNPGAYYKLTANVVINDPSLFEFEGDVIKSANGADEWTPIENFTGSFNGANYYITGLYVTEENANGGLFANINGGTVQNLNLDFALVESDEYAGILAGKIEGDTAEISQCMVAGSVIGVTTKSMNTAGGLAGLVDNGATVSYCVSYATVTGATSYSANVGGLVGINHGDIGYSGFAGNVFGTATYYDAAIGGIAGYNTGMISNCLVAAKVGGESTALVNDCYVGGIAGVNKGTVESCLTDDNSVISISNYSNGDSICAAGGTVGANFDSDLYYNTNNAKVEGEYSYLGGIAGIAVSDNGARYIEYNDNTGAVDSDFGVAGGIVGRAVAAGEGYVSIKLYVDECYNSGAVSGLAYGEMVGETANIESASVTVGEEVSANANSCAAPNIFVINADKIQYGTSATATNSQIAGTVTGQLSTKAVENTEKSDKKIIRFKRRSSTGAFLPAPVYVEVVSITDAGKTEALNLDVSDITYTAGKVEGEVVVKIYRPDPSVPCEVVIGTSEGNKFVAADFKTVPASSDKITFVTVPVEAEVVGGSTVTFNAIIVGQTNIMDPICENIEASK